MNKERLDFPELLVYNSRSGNGYEKEVITRTLKACWPEAAARLGLVTAQEFNTNKDLAEKRRVIVWAGDGTLAGVAEKMLSTGEGNQWCWGWSMGSINDIPTANGMVATGDMGIQVKYMRFLFEKGFLHVSDIPPGKAVTAGAEKAVLWGAGAGLSVELLDRIENGRRNGLTGWSRIIYGMSKTMQSFRTLPEYEIQTSDGDVRHVLDAEIIKREIPRFGGMRLPSPPVNKDYLWTIPARQPGYEAEQARTILLDALMLKILSRTSGRGIQIQAAPPNQELRITGGIEAMQIDSEIVRFDNPVTETIIYPRSDLSNNYRLVATQFPSWNK